MGQTAVVQEIVVVDASDGDGTAQLCAEWTARRPNQSPAAQPLVPRPALVYQRTKDRGITVQRSLGMGRTAHPFILFVDDDVELRPDCMAKLWEAVMSDQRVGGASAMLVNQQYQTPGPIGRMLYRLLAGKNLVDFAGRCLGPVVTMWPADREDLPEIVPVEWLNTTCTLYRREALPTPLFPDHFAGYSLGEDVHLSLVVGRTWKLVNARTARAVHHSRPGPYKPGRAGLVKMSLVNRHYIMTKTLGRDSLSDHFRLALSDTAGVLASLRSPRGWLEFPAVVAGKLRAVVEIVRSR